MTEEIRAFVAIELPDRVKDELANLVDQLRHARVRGMRLVNPQGIHLTLKFLGNVPQARVEAIVEGVSRAAAAHPPFAVALGAVGVFPNAAEPRVLWVGVLGDLDSMIELHKAVDGALVGLGYAGEKRQFSPHLTVARISRGTSSADRRNASEALYSAQLDSGLAIPVESIGLVRSILRPEGATYQRLARMPLAGDRAPGQAL